MRASSFESRFRAPLLALIYALGFWAPWERYTSLTLGARTGWLLLAALPARAGWLSFTAASQLTLVLAIVCAIAAALLRSWASAFRSAAPVQVDPGNANQALAAGPFRRTRNPLHSGIILNALALSILMPPTGALFTLLFTGLLQLRLAAADEIALRPLLANAYPFNLQRVPAWRIALRPQVPATVDRPNWPLGVLSELFFVGCAVSLIALGSRFNSDLVLRGVLISLGLALVGRAFLPSSPTDKPENPGN